MPLHPQRIPPARHLQPLDQPVGRMGRSHQPRSHVAHPLMMQAIDPHRRPAQTAGQQTVGLHRHLVRQEIARILPPVIVLDS